MLEGVCIMAFYEMKKYCVIGIKNGAVDLLYFEKYKKDAIGLMFSALSIRCFNKTAFVVCKYDGESGFYMTVKACNSGNEKIKPGYKIERVSDNRFCIDV